MCFLKYSIIKDGSNLPPFYMLLYLRKIHTALLLVRKCVVAALLKLLNSHFWLYIACGHYFDSQVTAIYLCIYDHVCFIMME